MTVLVLTVGGAPDPLVHAIERNKPSVLAFLASRKGAGTQRGSEDEVPRILETARWTGPTPIVESTDRPDELTAVWDACVRLAAKLPADGPIVANYSGGTKSMSAGLVTFALRAGWTLQLQTATRNDLVKVTANDTARRVAVGSIVAFDVRRQAAVLARRHDHGGAAALLEALLAEHELPNDLVDELHRDIASHRFEDAIESYDFVTAAALLADRGAGLAATHGATWGPRLRHLTSALNWLESKDAAPPKKLVDATPLVRLLIDTARRSAERGRNDDAFSRLYRATELLAQVVLRFAYDLRTGDLDRAKVPPAFAARLPSAPNGPTRIALRDSYELLSALGHPVGAWYATRASALIDVLKNRNESWLAHGFVPVTRALWNQHGERWIGLLDEALGACS